MKLNFLCVAVTSGAVLRKNPFCAMWRFLPLKKNILTNLTKPTVYVQGDVKTSKEQAVAISVTRRLERKCNGG